jgi:hypothetical protein
MDCTCIIIGGTWDWSRDTACVKTQKVICVFNFLAQNKTDMCWPATKSASKNTTISSQLRFAKQNIIHICIWDLYIFKTQKGTTDLFIFRWIIELYILISNQLYVQTPESTKQKHKSKQARSKTYSSNKPSKTSGKTRSTTNKTICQRTYVTGKQEKLQAKSHKKQAAGKTKKTSIFQLLQGLINKGTTDLVTL